MSRRRAFLARVQVLNKFGKMGATFAELKEKLGKYRRKVRRSRKRDSGEYGLLGDAISERSQLEWVSTVHSSILFKWCIMARMVHRSVLP